MTSQHFGCIHYGSPETSRRLKIILEFLLMRRETGATRRELREASGGEATNSDVAELRRWARDTKAPVDIPFAKYEGMTAGGSKVYRYWARRIEPGGQVVLI